MQWMYPCTCLDNEGNEVAEKICPFCRTPWPSSEEEAIEREKKRVEAGDPLAIHNTGNYYRDGRNGFPQDYTKALDLWHRAAKLGLAEAYNNIALAYENGKGMEVDKKKAEHYYKLAAMMGNAIARHNLGANEVDAGNMDRALKHFMIAVRGGYDGSLDTIKRMYSKGYATKEDYTKALQSYQAYLGEIKSPQRDKAATAHDEYRYY